MQKIKITSNEVYEFQNTTWKTFCSQDAFYLEVNLLGIWRVRKYAETLGEFGDALGFSNASKFYIESLSKGIPHYKIAVEFE